MATVTESPVIDGVYIVEPELHGDERGSVDDDHNAYGTPLVRPHRGHRSFETGLLKAPPLILSDPMRTVVDQAIRDHCALRGWRLHALNVRTTHVHAVVGSCGKDPSVMAGQLKGWSTRRLWDAGVVGRDAPVWTKRPSTRYLWNDEDLAAAVEYVVNGQ